MRTGERVRGWTIGCPARKQQLPKKVNAGLVQLSVLIHSELIEHAPVGAHLYRRQRNQGVLLNGEGNGKEVARAFLRGC